MGDSVAQFLILIRGSASLSERMLQAGVKSPFFPTDEYVLKTDPHTAVIRKQLHSALPLPSIMTAAARESLRLVEETCDLWPYERDMLGRMQSVVAMTNGPIEGEIQTLLF